MAETNELPDTAVGDILQMPRWHHQEWRKHGSRTAVFKFEHKGPRDHVGVFLFLGTYNPKKDTAPALAAVLESLGWVRKETTTTTGEPRKSASPLDPPPCAKQGGLITNGG